MRGVASRNFSPFYHQNSGAVNPKGESIRYYGRGPLDDIRQVCFDCGTQAEVAELADALGSGPSELTMLVEVQVLSSALHSKDLG